MSIKNIDSIFKPKSIAVIGASNREESIGSVIFRNLISGGYKGNLYPVNPKHKTVWEKQAYPSIRDINDQVDLAVLATPIGTAPKIIRECAGAGVGGAVIISAGGRETGQQGKEIEDNIKSATALSDLRIIGPNCLGIICSKSMLNASFARHLPIPGKMAFISQSGAICTSILDLSLKENIGFSYFISLGSMLDVEFGDIIDYLGDDPDVSSIVMYVESLTRMRNFMSAARAVSRIKPIIALKAGRTQAGARAAASHTGAMTGEDAVYDAAFKRAGIVRVRTFEELFDCAEMLSRHPRTSGHGLAILTNAGGPGVMAADAMSDYGMPPVALTPETINKLNTILPPHWSRGNPIDIIGDATPERYCQVIDICMNAKEVNGILVILSPVAMVNPTHVAEAVVPVIRKGKTPVFTSWIGGTDVEKGREAFNQAGIPTFDTPERAVRAFMDLYRYSINVAMLQEIPSKLNIKLEFDADKAGRLIQDGLESENKMLSEVEAKSLLEAYGIPVNKTETAGSENETVALAQKTGYPVVLKICSPKISHKSDVNGVLLNLRNEFEVREAYNRIMENARLTCSENDIHGVTVQKMITDVNYELIIGAKLDNDFGPVIIFGMGGIMTEIIKDRAIALPPLNRLLARRLMEETKIYNMLKGYRGSPPADLELLEEILIRLSHLVVDFPEVNELDINPLVINTEGVFAVDARVLVKPAVKVSPQHLVISTYPNQHEAHIVTKDGDRIFVRPVRPEDAPLMVDMFDSLSSQTVYRRFFSPLKRLPHRMLARFTQIDYDREIALVAIAGFEGTEKMLGVARVISGTDKKHAEFSVLIADHWQGKGIGAALLKRCLEISKERGVEEVHGTVLAENTQMLTLGKKLGFRIEQCRETSEYELTINLLK